MKQSSPQAEPSPATTRARRGNTIVLVTAILVLLVIIATAFVGRTRAVRQISAAQQSSAGRDGRGESIGVNVAQEIAGALFAKPVDTGDPFARTDTSVTPSVIVASSSWPRLAPALDAQRYSIDRDVLPPAGPTNPLAGDGLPDWGYNFAPYETKPWTNWPDQFGANPSPWPFGPGAPRGVLTVDGNPYGGPGMGDSRWLRSTEPVRVGVDQNADGKQDIFTFSHWTHLSWLPSANNGWRVVPDISNIALNTVDNLNENDISRPFAVAIPYEQWLPGVFPSFPAVNVGDPTSVNAFNNDFNAKRNAWFAPLGAAQNYATRYLDSSLALPNFFRLKGLGKPTDEFKPGTPRNTVARTFTDTDGDGFTDSFWFLAPVGVDRGVRTIVGVSVVDNSSQLNANVATKFSYGYDAAPSAGLAAPIPGTAGHTPADLALVTSNAEFSFGPAYGAGNTVGFFDGPINQPSNNLLGGFPVSTYWSGSPNIVFSDSFMGFDRERFGDRINGAGGPINAPASFLQAIGMRTANGFSDGGSPLEGYPLVDTALPANLRGSFESPRERLAYFKIVGLDPEKPLFGLTPFDASDEFELRAYHGNNLAGTLSRFEQAVSLYSPALQGANANNAQFLRASPMREESSEYIDQLDARQLLVDTRRKLTMFNGARNETMPPSLWPSPYYEETRNYMNPAGNVPATSSAIYQQWQQENRAEYERQKRKVDLREPMFVDELGRPQLTVNAFNRQRWRRDLTRALEASLASKLPNGTGGFTYQSYFGTRPGDYDRTRSMIASYVANIDTASDEASTLSTGAAYDRPLYPNQPFQDPNGFYPAITDAAADPVDPNRFYVGLEKQPFIMEVFIGLVYPKSNFDEGLWTSLGGTAPTGEVLPDGVQGAGDTFVDDSSKPSLVVAVQIANPYDTPVSLLDFRLSLFGQSFSFGLPGASDVPLGQRALPAATLGQPSTAIVYAVVGSPLGAYTAPGAFKQAVLDFFDIERGEMQGTAFQAGTDTDGDGIVEYAGLYDSRGVLPDADPQDRTLVFDATGTWKVDLTSGTTPYSNASAQPVELVRNVFPPAGLQGSAIQLVVDRLDNSVTGPEVKFNEAFNRLFTDETLKPPAKKYYIDPSRRYVAGIHLKNNDFYMPWCRVSRIWAFDVDTWDDNSVPLANKRIDAVERSPRYVFSMSTEPVRSTRLSDGVTEDGGFRTAYYKGDIWKAGQDPDGDPLGNNRWATMTWVDMFGRTLRSKPVFFSNLTVLRVGGDEVVATPGTGPMPFLPALNLPQATAPIGFQDCHGANEYNGVAYEWMIGNKGCSMADWNRFNGIDLAKIPFRMTQKDVDFEQVGEILDVFLWGHVYQNWGSPTAVRTFSEIMLEDDPDDEFYPGKGPFVNRLQIRLPGTLGDDDAGNPVLGASFDPASTTVPPARLASYVPWKPALPVGVSIFDALTIDGSGRNSFDRNANSKLPASLGPAPSVTIEASAAGESPTYDSQMAEERRFRLSHGYLGRKTSGLVNINTAMPEVMQTMPMMTRVPKVNLVSQYSHFSDMIRSYRDGGLFGAPSPVVTSQVPDFIDRGLTKTQLNNLFPGLPNPTFFPGMRREFGFASIGELALLQRARPANLVGTDPVAPNLRNSYSSQWLGLDPYAGVEGSFNGFDVGYQWATDRAVPRPRQLPADILTGLGVSTNIPTKGTDKPLGDAVDRNLLLKGISNLVTTRSDVFTVYLRVRQVRQNANTGIWDGTNADLIVDDSRYVMCVDRSEVNSPSDQPRIVYFQKCPE